MNITQEKAREIAEYLIKQHGTIINAIVHLSVAKYGSVQQTQSGDLLVDCTMHIPFNIVQAINREK